MSILLSGNEAIALGFLHSNGSFASGYPGTPSTEIIESLLQYKKIYFGENTKSSGFLCSRI